MFSPHGAGEVPRHEVVAAQVAVSGGESGEGVGEPGLECQPARDLDPGLAWAP